MSLFDDAFGKKNVAQKQGWQRTLDGKMVATGIPTNEKRLVAKGQTALSTAHKLQFEAGFGPIITNVGRIEPMTYNKHSKCLCLGLFSGDAHFLYEDCLWTQAPGAFAMDNMLVSITGKVADSTQWVIPAGNLLYKFILAVAGGYASGLIMVAECAMAGVQVAIFLAKNDRKVAEAVEHCKNIYTSIKWLKCTMPVTLQSLMTAGTVLLKERALGVTGWAQTDPVKLFETAAEAFGKMLVAFVNGKDVSGVRSFVEIFLDVLKGVLEAMGCKQFLSTQPDLRGAATDVLVSARQLIAAIEARGCQLRKSESAAIVLECKNNPGFRETLAGLLTSMTAVTRLGLALVEATKADGEVATLA